MFSIFDDVEARILSSLPEGPVHDPDDCPLCQLEEVRAYELKQELASRTRQILVNLYRTHRPAQGRDLRRP